MILNNMGIYYDMVGEWVKSINYYTKSLSIFRNHNNIIQTSNTMGNLGFAYSSLNQSEKAIFYFNESIKLSEKTGDIHNKGINSVHLSEEYLKKNDFKKTKYYIEPAEEIFNKLDDKLGLADVFKLKAILFKKQKKWEDSDRFFKKAINVYSKQRDRLNEGESYYEWGDLCILRNDKILAKKKLVKSKKILKKIGTKRYLDEIEDKLKKL